MAYPSIPYGVMMANPPFKNGKMQSAPIWGNGSHSLAFFCKNKKRNYSVIYRYMLSCP